MLTWMLAATCLSGCSEKKEIPATARVSGTVMFRGAPVEQGTIQFNPTETTKNPAIGTLTSGGKFSQLSTYGRFDGVAIGTHKVTIESNFDEPVDPWPAIPRSYMSAKTTPWTVEVVEDAGKNVFELVVDEKENLKR